METTRHFTATTYVVHEGAVALHEHDGIGTWLPPGGHVDRDELPHETAVREVREELGIDVELVAETDAIESDTVEPLPQPRHFQLADVNVTEQGVGHQHVDMVYYARAPHREVDPAEGEQPVETWTWFDREDLTTDDRLDADVVAIGLRAIDAVSDRR
ncbi:NUDIX hydrolase [Halomicrobium urmianum]|uniref:NUDIX hydrolase n=1 Tax=Halomicrobium urmianum TaxID=1586233 RepID=UPI001CD972D8|nr:NUDIX domain-containing protein [Halomicrobium urmianum]